MPDYSIQEGFMETVDILVKACPVPIHNMFKGYCSMAGKTISDGIIESMIEAIERSSGGANPHVEAVVQGYRKGQRR
jgi:hypothetical protein